MTKTLTLLIAHGSSDQNWSQTFEQLTAPATSQNGSIKLAFMELSQPSIEETIKSAAPEGYTHVNAVPLFLAKGRHLKRDIPKILEEVTSEHGMSFELQPPIGEHPELASAILRIIESLD